jgi:hypothetical protein
MVTMVIPAAVEDGALGSATAGAAGGAARGGGGATGACGPPGTTVIGVVTGTLPKEGAVGTGAAGGVGGTVGRGTAPIWADGAGLAGAVAWRLSGAAETTTMSRHNPSSPQATSSASRVRCLPVLCT